MNMADKPTIEELEKAIGTPDEMDILPDGSLQPKHPTIHTIDEIVKISEQAKRIAELEKAVEEWRNKADSELDINAKLHTLTAKLQQQITGLENDIIIMNDKCVKIRRELEQKNRLMRIDLAEALEYCIGDDIEAATKRLEEALN